MSLYANYLREKSFDEILETDKGFATYRFLDERKTVYIVDLYVLDQSLEKRESLRPWPTLLYRTRRNRAQTSY